MTLFQILNQGSIKVTVSGCSHGCWDTLYKDLKGKTDLLLLAGDVETPRNSQDIESSVVKDKYVDSFNNFIKYFEGRCEATVPTIFISGNHEAYGALLELPYGGWMAKNVFYTGFTNILDLHCGDVQLLSILAISGVYKEQYYMSDPIKKISSHQHKFDAYSIKHKHIQDILTADIKLQKCIAVSHDWPTNALNGYSNRQKLFGSKKRDLWKANDEGKMGCPYFNEIRDKFRPSIWFSAHHHQFIDNPNYSEFCDFVAIRGVAKPGPIENNYYSFELDCSGKSFSLCMNREWALHMYGLDLEFSYPMPETFNMDTNVVQTKQFESTFGMPN